MTKDDRTGKHTFIKPLVPKVAPGDHEPGRPHDASKRPRPVINVDADPTDRNWIRQEGL